MHKTSLKVPANKPRNGLVRALISKIRVGSGRHSLVREKRSKAKDESDLAQRVRECGEW